MILLLVLLVLLLLETGCLQELTQIECILRPEILWRFQSYMLRYFHLDTQTGTGKKSASIPSFTALHYWLMKRTLGNSGPYQRTPREPLRTLRRTPSGGKAREPRKELHHRIHATYATKLLLRLLLHLLLIPINTLRKYRLRLLMQVLQLILVLWFMLSLWVLKLKNRRASCLSHHWNFRFGIDDRNNFVQIFRSGVWVFRNYRLNPC